MKLDYNGEQGGKEEKKISLVWTCLNYTLYAMKCGNLIFVELMV